MANENLFRWITVGLMVLGYGISGYLRYRAEQKGGKLAKSGDRLVIFLRLLGLAGIWPLLVYMFVPAAVSWAQWAVPLWLRWMAVIVASMMIPLLYWLLTTIGENISPSHATRDGHKLITSGPYRWIRHPLYTFGFIFLFAVSLISALWWVTVFMFLPLSVIVWRTFKEEANLIEQFGDDYLAYMSETGRFFPRVGRA